MRKAILALSLVCLFATANDASACWFRKKTTTSACPTVSVAPTVSYAAPACGCGNGIGSSFTSNTGYYGGSSYAPSYYGSGYYQPRSSLGGYGMYPYLR